MKGFATLAVLALSAMACSTTVNLAPKPLTATVRLSEWARSLLTVVVVVVEDSRTDKGAENSALTSAIRNAVEAALSSAVTHAPKRLPRDATGPRT